MNLIFSYIIKSKFLKTICGLGLAVQTKAVIDQAVLTDQTFTESLLKNVPAKTLYILSMIYLVILVLDKVIKSLMNWWKKYKLDKIEISLSKEKLERSEIDTEKKKQEL